MSTPLSPDGYRVRTYRQVAISYQRTFSSTLTTAHSSPSGYEHQNFVKTARRYVAHYHRHLIDGLCSVSWTPILPLASLQGVLSGSPSSIP